MSDFNKKGARALQDAFTTGDKPPSYMFCLNLWRKHLDAARAKVGQPAPGHMRIWQAALDRGSDRPRTARGAAMSARDRRMIRELEAPASQRLTDEQEAFIRGVDTTRPDARNPFNKARLRTAWAFGRRFGEQDRRGLRPLDTARRIA